ncbi:uncharacterized protein N7484_008239 [Penicillium longicatenatum]|uniref:uncharacterized protein n=1 Tax=Penicillium longicatenatum TaxID=1561947 RepID=UPI0025480075|nr:uncharacterized protein N7484_008239 [Penicillium longicatenatum]KAJ5634926.1 hypothetical protein N7484_008239 [Penicillium longicatenatum]
MEFRDATSLRGLLSYSLRHPLESLCSLGPTLNEATFGLLGNSFKPEYDILSLEGKVILITGGETGIGKETILQLAKHHPARIYIAARSESKAREAIASIQIQLSSPVDIRYISLDLCSFRSIRDAMDQFQSDCDRLDILILNAGTMCNPPTKTEDGIETQLGTNYIGHFLLTNLLLPTLQRTVTRIEASGTTPDVRVVTLGSAAHVMGPASFEGLTSTSLLLAASTWKRYCASKAAIILFTAEFARRNPQILSISVHPGVVNSDLFMHAKATGFFMKYSLKVVLWFFRNVTTGALNTLWAATTNQDNLVNGAYYTPVGFHSHGASFVQDADIAQKLWDWTEAQFPTLNYTLCGCSG